MDVLIRRDRKYSLGRRVLMAFMDVELSTLRRHRFKYVILYTKAMS